MTNTTFEQRTANGAIFDRPAVMDSRGAIAPGVAIVNAMGEAIGLNDSFGRLRVSNPQTLFDSKQLWDNQPLIWDDQAVSGAGTSSSHDPDLAASTLGVSDSTAGKRVRQTFQSFNYQPGKSLLALLTGVLDKSGGGAGIASRIGYFNDENGVYFGNVDGVPVIGKRSYASGAAVDTVVAQSAWNYDPLDGTGPSGKTLDLTKTQIFWIDIEWLGVGSVRLGVVIDGLFIPVHIFKHANVLDTVYMSTANLPLRYEIENDGTGGAATMTHICSTLLSEGGEDDLGVLRYASTGGTHVDANAANELYAVIGIRLKSTHLNDVVKLVRSTMAAQTTTDFEWVLLFNPTVAGTFTYADQTNSGVQIAKGATANTVTDGTLLDGGIVKSSAMAGSTEAVLNNALRLGAAIDGTPDTIVLAVRPLDANADIEASLTWRELS